MSDVTVDGRSVYQLKVVELKIELEKRGLSKSGKKDELLARLASFLEVGIIYFPVNLYSQTGHNQDISVISNKNQIQ